MTSEITYHIELHDGAVWSHSVPMAEQSASALAAEDDSGEDWTRLDHHQCEHCPLSTDQYRDCPLALALKPVLAKAGAAASHDQVRVRVSTEARDYAKECSMQRAVGSLFGVVSAFSGCPHTRLLRPLARFHLPFSVAEETTARVLGMYLAGQFVRAQHGRTADWSLAGLRTQYQNLRKVNRGISARLKEITMQDAAPNSMVLLDVLAADVEYALDMYEGELDRLFREFLDEPEAS
ncbi:DUF6901 family protein [Marinobacter sp. SS21]|uniref:DUF6901 family protein n=1 Tax=Marinobacter sp. SS21 TaxID=2979460 RepID=UPI00232F0030|nr:hypothetical protein [Marinobacter sp. SS21]MDC0663776.1 hypothetical protein [Marinobacter sp. SS21]